MRKQMMTLAMAGALSVASVLGAAAAGVGYVNSGALFQAHPKMAKAELTLQSAAQAAQHKFEQQAQGKDENQQRQLAMQLQQEMAQQEQSVMMPIQKDILDAINKVLKENGLDIIVDQQIVVAGGVDVTADVANKLK